MSVITLVYIMHNNYIINLDTDITSVRNEDKTQIYSDTQNQFRNNTVSKNVKAF